MEVNENNHDLIIDNIIRCANNIKQKLANEGEYKLMWEPKKQYFWW